MVKGLSCIRKATVTAKQQICTWIVFSFSSKGIVVRIADREQVQHALPGMNIRDINRLFAVEFFCIKNPVEKLLSFMQLLAHLLPLPVVANLL